jgi:sugar O-acyltransferase (sialic acid O-acetyltransferase NeuD family)
MANAVINPFVKIGEACIVNTASTIDHDCILQDAVHVSPGSNLGGGVEVGFQSWVGIGACVKQYLKIGSGATIGAGAAVVNDVPAHQTVVGIPARPQSER